MNIINLKFVVSGLISQIFRQYNYHNTQTLCSWKATAIQATGRRFKFISEVKPCFTSNSLLSNHVQRSSYIYFWTNHHSSSRQTITAAVKTKSHHARQLRYFVYKQFWSHKSWTIGESITHRMYRTSFQLCCCLRIFSYI